MAADKEDLEKLKNLVGKKILAVKPKFSWDKEIDGVELSLDDGAKVEINSGALQGCSECDPEGCNTNPLSFWFRETK